MCDYAEAYILVDGTIRADAEAPPLAAPANIANARLNCAPFTKCNLETNDEHVDTAENLDIAMPMYIQIIIKIHQLRFININEMNHQMILQII